MLSKAIQDNRDQHLALLELRNTPRQDSNCSPAQLMFNREAGTRSKLPTLQQSDQKPHYDPNRRKTYKEKVRKNYNRNARDMSKLNVGQPIYFQHPKKGWVKGTIRKQISDCAYIVKNFNGVTNRRNRVHIRPQKDESASAYDYYTRTDMYVPPATIQNDQLEDQQTQAEVESVPSS